MTTWTRIFAGIGIGYLAVGELTAVEPDGAAIYEQSCKTCHETGQNRAPTLDALHRLSPEAILASLRDGVMADIGKTLPTGAAETVSAYLGRGTDARLAASVPGCPDTPWRNPMDGPRWVGWSADIENTRYQPGTHAGLDIDSVPRLELLWAFGVPDADRVRAQPAIAGGRLYFGERGGRVHALDAKTGCSIWQFQAQAEVRTAIEISVNESDDDATLYFGDTRTNLYALEARTGKQIWVLKLDSYPAATLTASPVLHDGRLYVGLSSIEEFTGMFPEAECCKFRGRVVAVDATSGDIAWETYTIPEEPTPRKKNKVGVMQYGPSGAGIWSAPTLDTKLGRLYVGTGDNYSDPPTDDSDAIIAFDMATGERLWTQQFTKGDAFNMACGGRRNNANCPEARGPDFDFGASPILVELEDGKRVLVAGQKSGMVHAMDPDRDGEVLWQRRAGLGSALGGIQFGPGADSQNVYVAVSDIKYGQQELPDGTSYRGPLPNTGGGLSTYRLKDGERLWHVPGIPCPSGRRNCSPGQSAAVTVIPGVVFSGALDGVIRAFSTEDGSVLWSYDTVREYTLTVNGVPATGGSLNGPGPVVVDGILYVNSGYGQFGSIAGNAILAFGLRQE